MSINNLQNKLHSCQETIYIVSMASMVGFNAQRFAEWLTTAYTASAFKSYSQLGAAVGVSRATISNLIGAKEQLLTGKPSQPKAELVEKIARALNKDINEALLMAGHAPVEKQKQIRVDDSISIIGIDGNDIDPNDLAAMKSFIAYTIEKNKKK